MNIWDAGAIAVVRLIRTNLEPGWSHNKSTDHHDTLKKVFITILILCSKFVSDTIFDTFLKKVSDMIPILSLTFSHSCFVSRWCVWEGDPHHCWTFSVLMVTITFNVVLYTTPKARALFPAPRRLAPISVLSGSLISTGWSRRSSMVYILSSNFSVFFHLPSGWRSLTIQQWQVAVQVIFNVPGHPASVCTHCWVSIVVT